MNGNGNDGKTIGFIHSQTATKSVLWAPLRLGTWLDNRADRRESCSTETIFPAWETPLTFVGAIGKTERELGNSLGMSSAIVMDPQLRSAKDDGLLLVW